MCRPFVPPTKIQAAVKPRPFLHKVAAANPEFEKSLLQVFYFVSMIEIY